MNLSWEMEPFSAEGVVAGNTQLPTHHPGVSGQGQQIWPAGCVLRAPLLGAPRDVHTLRSLEPQLDTQPFFPKESTYHCANHVPGPSPPGTLRRHHCEPQLNITRYWLSHEKDDF